MNIEQHRIWISSTLMEGSDNIYDYTNINIINKKAKFYAKELWNLDFNIPIKLNGKLQKSGGVFSVDKNYSPIQITLARYNFDKYHNELVADDVLLHELCHWANLILHKNVDDGSKDFEDELKRIGSSSSKTFDRGGKYYYGKCKKCGKNVAEELNYETLKRRLNTSRYYTRCCQSQIIYGGTIEHYSKLIPTNKLIKLNNKFKEYWMSKSA